MKNSYLPMGTLFSLVGSVFNVHWPRDDVRFSPYSVYKLSFPKLLGALRLGTIRHYHHGCVVFPLFFAKYLIVLIVKRMSPSSNNVFNCQQNNSFCIDWCQPRLSSCYFIGYVSDTIGFEFIGTPLLVLSQSYVHAPVQGNGSDALHWLVNSP